jgi:hypothetical protein
MNTMTTYPTIERLPARKYYPHRWAVGTVVLIGGQPFHFTGTTCHHDARRFIEKIKPNRARS